MWAAEVGCPYSVSFRQAFAAYDHLALFEPHAVPLRASIFHSSAFCFASQRHLKKLT